MRALFLPYAYAVLYNGQYYWQRNLGQYLSGLSSGFNHASILCRVARPGHPDYFRDGIPIYAYKLDAPVEIVEYTSFRADGFARHKAAIRRADCVIVFLPSLRGIWAAVQCSVWKKPWVAYLGGQWDSLLPRRFPRALGALAARLCDAVTKRILAGARFSVSPSPMLVRQYGAEPNRMYLSPPAVMWGHGDAANRADTCSGKTVTLLFVGALRPQKGVDFLLRAYSLALRDHPELRLRIVGTGSAAVERQLQNQCRALDLHPESIFAGYIADPALLREEYRRADIFVLPTRSEGFPRVAYEAMSQGLPCIMTSIPGITSTIRTGKEAWLIPPDNPEALAEGVSCLLENPSLRQSLIREGYAFSRDRMDTGASVRFFAGLLSKYLPGWSSAVTPGDGR